MWICDTGELLQGLVARGRWPLRQLSDCIIKPGPVTALADIQRLEPRHLVVVGPLQGKAGVVRLRHPPVIAAQHALVPTPLGSKPGIAGTKVVHDFFFESKQ
jgi:hypothetical protein